jgi:hypothetical protein
MNKPMEDLRSVFTLSCLQSLLNVLTPEDMMLFKRNPDDWKRFCIDISKQAVVLADTALETLEETTKEQPQDQ